MSDKPVKKPLFKFKNVRLAFPNLFEAKAVAGDPKSKPKFGCTFIMAPDHEAVVRIKAEIDRVGKEKWGAKWPAIKAEMVKKDKLCFRESDKTNTTGEVYAGFEDMFWLAASSDVRPNIKDVDGTTPLTAADGKPYAGCYVLGMIDIWPQDNKHGKRINAQLKGVQFFRDGDAFSGGSAASDDEFGEDLSDEAAAAEESLA